MKKYFKHFISYNKKSFNECINNDVQFSNWTNFKNEDLYLKGYFDFPLYSHKDDSPHKRIRSFTLLSFVESIVNRSNYENFAECGCYLGHSSYAISTILQSYNFQKSFYIFDSFEGLSKINEEDISKPNEVEVAKLLKEHKSGKLRFKGDLDSYKDITKDFKFLKILDGWIPNRFAEVKSEKFSLVNIDVDLYLPTLDSLKFFFSRLVSGGIIYIDDYSRPYWPGADKAVYEFLDSINKNEYFFIKIPLGGAIIQKI